MIRLTKNITGKTCKCVFVFKICISILYRNKIYGLYRKCKHSLWLNQKIAVYKFGSFVRVQQKCWNFIANTTKYRASNFPANTKDTQQKLTGKATNYRLVWNLLNSKNNINWIHSWGIIISIIITFLRSFENNHPIANRTNIPARPCKRLRDSCVSTAMNAATHAKNIATSASLLSLNDKESIKYINRFVQNNNK